MDVAAWLRGLGLEQYEPSGSPCSRASTAHVADLYRCDSAAPENFRLLLHKGDGDTTPIVITCRASAAACAHEKRLRFRLRSINHSDAIAAMHNEPAPRTSRGYSHQRRAK
jgi:hypothetical protein